MPTTIVLPPSVNRAQRCNPSGPDRSDARVGFEILMLWAVVMLSIGGAAHFGAQSSEYSAFELIAP